MSPPPLNPHQQFVTWLFALAQERPVSLLDLLPDLHQTSDSTFHGPCPFCGEGSDRLVFWCHQEPSYGGRYHCRQCGKTGNGIHFLRQFHGWSFPLAWDLFTGQQQAPSLPPLRQPGKAPSWLSDPQEKARVLLLTDQYRDLLAAIEIAEIAVRALSRVPALYTEEETSYWTGTLSTLYAQRDGLDLELAAEEEQRARDFSA